MNTKDLSIEKKKPEFNVNSPAIMDVNEIYEILPHRYPFTLVDKILKIEENKIISLKNVTFNEPFFQGHFPGNPVMPGVLQVEALAQTGGVLMIKKVEDPSQYWTYFLGIEKCKFRKMVIPGDTLIMECEIDGPVIRNMVKINGKTFVNNKLTCEAKLMAMIVEKSKLNNNGKK